MKEKLLLLIVTLSVVTSYSQIINFPDANFKDDLINHFSTIDTNNDGEINITEAQNYTGDLFIGGGQDIVDVTGIHFFTNITGLFMRSNLITELDLSNNKDLRVVQVDGNKISKMNLGNNIILEALYCSFNELTDLDLSKYPSLSFIDCRNNSDLKILDIANRNNHAANFFLIATSNPKLECINIDTGFTPPANGHWQKDTWASYSHICKQSTDSQVDLGFPTMDIPESSNKESDDIIVYPNPANNVINIQSIEKIKNITVFTFKGSNVLEVKSTSELDISILDKGMYWLFITTESEIIRKKMIKE